MGVDSRPKWVGAWPALPDIRSEAMIPLASAEGVVLYLYRNGVEVENAGFEVPPDYSGDGWLRVDGSISAEPCSAGAG